MDTLADAASPKQIAEAAARLGCRSVAFTYNDPVIFMEYAMDVADACRERGLRAVAVTAGYMTAGPRAEFYRHMDAANVDLKTFSDDFYHRICAGRRAACISVLGGIQPGLREVFGGRGDDGLVQRFQLAWKIHER